MTATTEELIEVSASSSSPEALVNLASVAETAALEAAMEGSWLPTRTLQWVLETVHQGTGLEWWQSIMLTTVGIRGAMLPLMLMQIKNTYRLSQARPEVEHLVARLKEEQARGNQNATADYQQQVMAVWKKYNCNPLKSMATVFVQAPLFIGFFSALRGLAAAKVPSMVDGGTLWFNDLTVADPTYALPVISAATFLLMVELNAADGMEGQTDKMRKRFKNIMRGGGGFDCPVHGRPSCGGVYVLECEQHGLARAEQRFESTGNQARGWYSRPAEQQAAGQRRGGHAARGRRGAGGRQAAGYVRSEAPNAPKAPKAPKASGIWEQTAW